jgi:choline dehydrogenase
MESYDVLVLGGGTAGCVLAARLSEEPDCSVCLVEAGPDYGSYGAGDWPADILDARMLPMTHLWEQAPEDRSTSRARVIGGCSAHNACVALRGVPADYDEWGPGWTNEEVEPYLERSERELRVRPLEVDELSPWHAAWAAAAAGEAILHPVNVVGTVRWNTAFAYLDAARRRANLEVVADAVVDRVHLDREVRALLADGRELVGRTAVLTAGAYGSPGILLRSGIGPADELERHQVPLVAELPVGEGLVDHVGAGLGWTPTERLRTATTEFETRLPSYMAQVTVRRGPDLFVFPALDPGCEISAAVFAMKPYSRGRVRLNGRGAETPVAIDHGFLADPRDADSVAEGVEAARALARGDALADLISREDRPGPEADVDTYVRENARGFFHPVATCAIGRVVDAGARLFGFENLFVADASIMPTIPRANTSLSVVAIAERVAELVSEPLSS